MRSLKDVSLSHRSFSFSGAGVVEMRFFTRVNVTDVKVHGTATRGEKIDYQSYQFEGEVVSESDC